MVLHFLEFALMFFTLPETKGRSIEELNNVFNSRNPVKESLRKTTVVVRAGHGVKDITEASGDV